MFWLFDWLAGTEWMKFHLPFTSASRIQLLVSRATVWLLGCCLCFSWNNLRPQDYGANDKFLLEVCNKLVIVLPHRLQKYSSAVGVVGVIVFQQSLSALTGSYYC